MQLKEADKGKKKDDKAEQKITKNRGLVISVPRTSLNRGNLNV